MPSAVGDSAGQIHSLKLSPNLRKQSKEVKLALINRDTKKAGELEIKKLEDILAQVLVLRKLNQPYIVSVTFVVA